MALQRRADVRLLRHGGQPHRLRIDRGTCRRRRSNLREKPAGNPGGGRASLETGPCDHLLLYIYIVPHTLPAGNDIGDTTPFEVEIRIAYGERRLRAEKRLINQWSGASIEMRVDSEAR